MQTKQNIENVLNFPTQIGKFRIHIVPELMCGIQGFYHSACNIPVQH